MKIALVNIKHISNKTDLSIFNNFGDVDIITHEHNNELIKKLSKYEVIVVNKLIMDKKILLTLPKLKLIALASTGMDNIDLIGAKELGITVKNVKGYAINGVAQHTFALLLSLIDHIPYYNDFCKNREHGWSNHHSFTNSSKKFIDINGKNWGIIGFGDIGEKVAKIAEAFGANIFTCSPRENIYKSKYKQLDKNELFKKCDIVSIHTPLNEYSDNFVTYKDLIIMKEPSYIINVARGKIINEKDMAKILNEKNIYHATDVLEDEPMNKNHPYFDLKDSNKLIITPHMAWSSDESRELMIKNIYDNIEGYIEKSK